MSEYIERGALMRFFDEMADNASIIREVEWTEVLKEMSAHIKTADVVEVKHGEWLEPIWDSDWHSMTATCSHCRERGEVRFKRNLQNILVIDSPRCPACGAFMRGYGGADNAVD